MKLVKRILIFTAVIETVGGIILSIRFSFDMPIGKAIYYGFFHAISNFNNAGFDIMGGFRSLTGYVDDPTVVLTICALITLGGLGFIVWNELYEYHETHRLSVHSKVVLLMTVILTVGATILILLFEYGNDKTYRATFSIWKSIRIIVSSGYSKNSGLKHITNWRFNTIDFISNHFSHVYRSGLRIYCWRN